jgi:hypothetical protein
MRDDVRLDSIAAISIKKADSRDGFAKSDEGQIDLRDVSERWA